MSPLHLYPYPCKRIGDKTFYVHRLIFGPLPKGVVVHHRDEDPENNERDNLQLLPSQRVHMRIHNGWVLDAEFKPVAKPCGYCKEVKPISEFYRSYGRNEYQRVCKDCHRKYNTEWSRRNALDRVSY